MKKLMRLITDEILAHPAWAGVSTIVAIIALASSVIHLSSDELNTSSTEVETGQPKWITELRHNPIVPNEGIAGLKIGDQEKKILQFLGTPTDSSDVIVDEKYIIDNRKGRIIHYATTYVHQELFLGIYTEPDRKLIKSFRLYDKNFNTTGILPSFKGVTIGSTKELLIQQLGEPLATHKHDTCPNELRKDKDKDSSGDAITYYYRGISFWVCTENNLIYLIDIKKQA